MKFREVLTLVIIMVLIGNLIPKFIYWFVDLSFFSNKEL